MEASILYIYCADVIPFLQLKWFVVSLLFIILFSIVIPFLYITFIRFQHIKIQTNIKEKENDNDNDNTN